MGRAASHITLECALQTHPNITLIGEEVAAKKQTLKIVTDYIADVICKRAELGYNYGVILILEGLIDFIQEVQELISELNEILAHDVFDEAGVWKRKITPQSLELFYFLPPAIQEQLMLERDLHGNVQVDAALIATGRAPFTKGIGLENINVETQRGFIPVDEGMRVIDAGGKLVI